METRLRLPILRNCLQNEVHHGKPFGLWPLFAFWVSRPQECVIGYEPISAVYCLRLYLQLS
jgi:hypothetical protein